MKYDHREDTEYYSRGSEYRILSDEMKILDNEFQAGRGAKTGNAAEERQSLQKRMRRFRVLMSTLFLAASTAVISGGGPKKEPLPQKTSMEAVVSSETAVNEETVEETQAIQEAGVILSESEKAYLDSLAKALADQDRERAKELIVDPLLETIYVDRYGGESYIYADGKCYPSDEFTGTGLWIEWKDGGGHKNFPASGWAQFENGVAYGEGVDMYCLNFREDYYVSHAYTWYAGQFDDGRANGQGEYLDEYFKELSLETTTKSKGEFRDGQIYSGTVDHYYNGSATPGTSYVVQDGKAIKRVEITNGETTTFTGKELEDDGDSAFGNDIFIN